MIIDINNKLEKYNIKAEGEIKGPYQIVVPFSGGKDSQSCLKLATQNYQKDSILALFFDTKFEHPITYEHVINSCKKYGVDLVTVNAGSVLDVCTKYKRFPDYRNRHCTDELKLRPSKFFYKHLAINQGGFQVWLGVRSDESLERKKRYHGIINSDIYTGQEIMPKKYPKYLEKLNVLFRFPVIDWGKNEVFEFLEGEENPLYSMGFERVGCFPCLAAGEKYKVKAYTFDEVGKNHFNIAKQIGEISNSPVLVTNKYSGKGPGCSICSI